MQTGLRFNKGKRRWSLVDFKSLEGMVEVLEFGSEKYDDHNWKKGHKMTEVCDSLLRHLFAWMDGEDLDPESGKNHIDHVLCNAMFLKFNIQNKPDMDDRYRVPKIEKSIKTNRRKHLKKSNMTKRTR